MIRKVACAISGGVDSAVAALKLKRQGFDVFGVYMRNWDALNEKGICSSDVDAADAHSVCRHLGIPFFEVNFVKEYWNEVFSDLLAGYENGFTPNPDVLCNRHIKFGHFLRHATTNLNADAIATGHYARSSAGPFLNKPTNSDYVQLLRPVDDQKDQTLFLSQISQESLRRTMFPLGDLRKSSVKEIAVRAGLRRIAEKKESTGLCFVGKRNFQQFIDEYLEPQPGSFVDYDTGEVVGHHQGIHCWTIGQRALIGGRSTAYFVVDRDKESQTIFVASGTNHPALYSAHLATGPFHCVGEPLFADPAAEQLDCEFRFQHSYTPVPCRVRRLPQNCLDVQLERPIRALTPGQYAVIYRGMECVGSAVIQAVCPSDAYRQKTLSNKLQTAS